MAAGPSVRVLRRGDERHPRFDHRAAVQLRPAGRGHPSRRTARGWVVRNVSAVRNYWAGLMAADGMRILGGHYNDNDQLGIGGNAAAGIVLDGLDSDPTTFDGPEMARNHSMPTAAMRLAA